MQLSQSFQVTPQEDNIAVVEAREHNEARLVTRDETARDEMDRLVDQIFLRAQKQN